MNRRQRIPSSERILDTLKCIRSDTPTQREIERAMALSSSTATSYLRLLERHGFITSEKSIDKQSRGRAPRVYSLADEWGGTAGNCADRLANGAALTLTKAARLDETWGKVTTKG